MSVSSEFDIFAHKQVQISVQATVETIYIPIASVDQSDLQFKIPADYYTYIDLNIRLFVRGKLTAADGKDLQATDFTAVTNNLLHSLFTQFSLNLNCTSITQSTDLYQYRAYLETLLTYGTDALSSNLTNAYWYIDNADLLACDPTNAESIKSTNHRFIARWDRIRARRFICSAGYTAISATSFSMCSRA